MQVSRALVYSGLVTTTIGVGAGVLLAERSRRETRSANRSRAVQLAVGIPVAIGAIGLLAVLVKKSMAVISPPPAGPRIEPTASSDDDAPKGEGTLASTLQAGGTASGADEEELSGVGIGAEISPTGPFMRGGKSTEGTARRRGARDVSTAGGDIGSDLTHGGLRETDARGEGATDLPESRIRGSHGIRH
jgi:hypothetical protein